ncbi:MAG TPA: hypothetical protein VNG31_05775 [Candidatus Baltobacteraceae bacterium]|nr:hypothetical protein [Candidatus Baltobacteraceae bacterium]
MSAVAILLVFALFAMAMYLRWLPALVAVPLMALGMSLAAGVPFGALGGIFTGGAAALAPVYVAVIFGALLGRVTIDTGIARAMVNLAAEYGGERPLALALGLCVIVALLFTSLSGLGAIIMVGSIVLPIMMTTGVPRTIAATLFLMAFALGFIFNITNWTFYTKYFGVSQDHLLRFAIVLAIVDAVALIVYAIVSFRRESEYATWAVEAEPADDAAGGVPGIALVTPFLPLVFYYALHVDAAPAFAISAAFGVVTTRWRDGVQTLVAAAIRGLEDVAPAVLLFMGIGMLLVATQQPQLAAALRPLFAGNWIDHPIAYVVLFGLGSPLALYRGPLNPFGVGIAVFTVLLTSHALPPVVLIAAVMAVVQVQNVCDPTNTSNVWVANFTGVTIDTILKRTLPYQTAVAVVATLAVVLASPALFGFRAFAALLPPALAQAPAMATGFFAPAAAHDRIAVGNDARPLSSAASAAVVTALDVPPWHAVAMQSDPNLTDCAHKPYAAYVDVTTSQFALIEGTDLDVGLRLEDCGGWIVDEWHDHRVVPGSPTRDLARTLAIQGVARLQRWARAEPVKSANLFALGAAIAPGDPPTYFYSLFKTVDGNMRVYVRAGGPAYVAGMRSGDVVDKLDGRYWWEYGTYQTQARAFDGKPHSFVIERNGKPLDVQLGVPFEEPT